MQKTRITLFTIMTCLWMVFLPKEPTLADSPAVNCTRSVVDRTGSRVCLPAMIHKILITCYGGVSHEIALLGGVDKIVAQPSADRFPLFTKIFPLLANQLDAGSFNNVNLEQVMALNPDIVFAGVISTQTNKRIKDLGFPVVVLGIGRTDIAGLLHEFKLMGYILGAEQTAAALVDYWQEKLALVQKAINAMPGLERKKVLYTSSGPPFRIEGNRWWGHHFIMAGGGIDVTGAVGRHEVTTEQIVVWNPDVIITTTNKGRSVTANGILGNTMLKNVNAVENHAVYTCPVGAFWWDRPSPEAILGIMWLAKTLYPNAMRGLDLRQETRIFFSRFYHYRLEEQEYDAFFSLDKEA